MSRPAESNVYYMSSPAPTRRDTPQNPSPTLSGSGGGGTFDGMEARVSKLETLMDVVRTDVGTLKTDVRDVRDRLIRLEERVTHLPTKGWAVGAIVTLVGLITAVVTLAPKLQSLFGIVP